MESNAMTPGQTRNPTQCRDIVEYLGRHPYIDCNVADKKLGITQFHTRMSELRDRGYVFGKTRSKRGVDRRGKPVSINIYWILTRPGEAPTLSLGATPKPKAVSAGQHYGE